MPCGGIYTIPDGHAMRKDSRCFACSKREPECELFCEEWDCTIHIACLSRFLGTAEGRIVLQHKHDIHVQYGATPEIPFILACEMVRPLVGESADMAKEIHRLNAIIEANGSQKVVTCVFCGHAYGPDDGTTPTHKAEMLTKHASQCPEHPMLRFVNIARRMNTILVADLSLAERPSLLALGKEVEAALDSLDSLA